MKPTIKLVLFDLDNTLIDTHGVFIDKKNEVLRFWGNHFSEETVRQMSMEWDTFLVEAFHLYSVNPKKIWPHVVEGLNKNHKHFTPLIEESSKILWSIYTTLPAEFPGAKKLLANLHRRNIPIGLVTHAEKEWTDFKVDGHDIRKYFHTITMCDVTKPKSGSDWLAAIEKFGVTPEETIIVGDSITGDMIAGQEIGVRNLLWVNVTPGWKIYNSGTLPDGVMEIHHLDHINIDKIFS